MSEIAGRVAAAVLAVASLSAAGTAASVVLPGGIGWDSSGRVTSPHAPDEAARSAVTSDNVVGTR